MTPVGVATSVVALSVVSAWCSRIRPRGPTDAAAAATSAAADVQSVAAGSASATTTRSVAPTPVA